ncbi:MAG: hypothetical protein M1827_002770 [Pycnora praestabilis]|nr:MAG: hypothetical protein M1827_002770 [Pycnora praestabilis]
MPYNTRRKSLSLPSLGIHLPPSSRALTHRSPPATKSNDQPPSKRVKRSHTLSSPASASPLSKTVTLAKDVRPKSAGRVYEHTPPPSPEADGDTKIDTEGINDDIVTGVIEQLEKTGNRPHLIKELAAVLSSTSTTVESSANPSAIISSRLTAYIRRPWTALSPCPLGKTLIPVHPRRIYFYLTTTPHQPFPEASDIVIPHTSKNRIISPSLSSISAEDDEAESRTRSALSPSPEIDLSSPELDDEDIPPTPAGSFSGRSSLARDGTHPPSTTHMAQNHRAASPPLEGDEKEFTQTASSMQKRSVSQDDTVRMTTEEEVAPQPEVQVASPEETEESARKRNSEAAALLFGHSHPAPDVVVGFSSPFVRPTHLQLPALTSAKKIGSEMDVDTYTKGEHGSVIGEHGFGGWGGEMLSPERVELDELDDLFGGF